MEDQRQTKRGRLGGWLGGWVGGREEGRIERERERDTRDPLEDHFSGCCKRRRKGTELKTCHLECWPQVSLGLCN